MSANSVSVSELVVLGTLNHNNNTASRDCIPDCGDCSDCSDCADPGTGSENCLCEDF